MLKKRRLANGKVRVVFSMPAVEAQMLYLVGDFNDWDEKATPMERIDDSTWSVTLTLEGNREYQYRYLTDAGVWHNDWAADAYMPNNFGADNSVLSLLVDEKPKRPAAKKKTSAKKK